MQEASKNYFQGCVDARRWIGLPGGKHADEQGWATTRAVLFISDNRSVPVADVFVFFSSLMLHAISKITAKLI